MRDIEILENPETGTAGLSSAFQLVESTSSVSIQFGTTPGPIVTFPVEEKPEVKRDETFREILRRSMERHRKTLDKLDEF